MPIATFRPTVLSVALIAAVAACGSSTPSNTGSAPDMADNGLVASTIANNGYVTSGAWHGYAFTYQSTNSGTISPACPTPCFSGAGAYLCASGSLNVDPTFGAVAELGIHLNQDSTDPGGSGATVATTGTGLTVNVHVKSGAANARVQVQDDKSNRWCALLPANGQGTIPWTSFNSKCWDGSGTAYAVGTPISQAAIVVPSDGAAARPFDFCLVSIAPAP